MEALVAVAAVAIHMAELTDAIRALVGVLPQRQVRSEITVLHPRPLC
jgi:hypothetical protein